LGFLFETILMGIGISFCFVMTTSLFSRTVLFLSEK